MEEVAAAATEVDDEALSGLCALFVSLLVFLVGGVENPEKLRIVGCPFGLEEGVVTLLDGFLSSFVIDVSKLLNMYGSTHVLVQPSPGGTLERRQTVPHSMHDPKA